jgi:hypothetical protein
MFRPAVLRIIKNMNIENECKDAQDAHAALVRDQQHKPYIYGAQQSEETQVDMDAFDEALFADTTLDDEGKMGDTEERQTESSETDPNIHDIQHCLRAGLDGGLFTSPRECHAEDETFESADTYLVSDNKQGRLPEFVTLMKAAKKRKRPVDVGSSDAEVKQCDKHVSAGWILNKFP